MNGHLISSRRQVLAAGAAAAISGLRPSRLFADDSRFAQHFPAAVTATREVPLPQGKRLPFGWKAATVSGEEHPPVRLSWKDWPTQGTPTKLRIAIGLDCRDAKLVEAFLPQSNRVVGTFDIRFGSIFQPYEIALKPEDLPAIKAEGVALRLMKGADLRVLTDGLDLSPELQPHLLLPGTASPTAEFHRRMLNLSCIQPFGWMEGCVMDGLLDLADTGSHPAAGEAAKRHLGLFFKNGKLVYENPRGDIADGRVYGIEGSLPFAALSRTSPDHPLLELAVKFWLSKRDADGAIIDGKNTSSEGAYTVGYPLARVARVRKDNDLELLALRQLSTRQARLFDGKVFHRTSDVGGKKGNRNWARGIAWQLVGMARTLGVLRDRNDLADLISSFRSLCTFAMSMQRDDGLWAVFADQKSLTPDTGGSAGIAVALALGAKQGWLGADARAAAARTLTGLQSHLTPDGFLGGVSQSNKGGEELQRGRYRVIYQMGMGLKAQLIAALA